MTTFADVTDTSLLIKDKPVATPDFSVKTFASCTDMRTKVADFMELYYEKHPPYQYPIYDKGGPMMLETTAPISAVPPAAANVGQSTGGKSATSADHSTTNSRTIGVDEPERVKTDGNYLYSANDTEHMVYIHKADDTLQIIKKIALPAEYSNTELFVDGDRLVIVASKYVYNNLYRSAWIDRASKTVVVTYNIADINNPVIDRYYQIDGNYREARLTNGELTVLSTTSFNFPYERYVRPHVKGTELIIDTDKLTSEFSSANVLPRKIEIAPTSKIDNINDYLTDSRKTARLRELYAGNCADVSYVFPDAKTLESYNFTPSFTAVTTLNIRNNKQKSHTKLLFGDVDKTYVSPTNKLYVTSTLYSPYSNACPPGAMCLMRFMQSGTNTLIHKFDLSNLGARYEQTGIVGGSLLSDYAIDEGSDGSVRVVTHKTDGKTDNVVSVLGKNLIPVSTLAGIAPTENFQSARFIGDKLYLVTFKQIDPLFVIDLADSKNPKILGELKIPGYSTYLHPYDATHLIGIGYDTSTNEWGGTQNNGIKIDLYDISDFKNPKQQSTLTLGNGPSTYSDALSNPRLFVWQKSKNLLYLPASLYKVPDTKNPYRYSDIFQGVVALSITPETGVVEKARTTHLDIIDDKTLEAARTKECLAYSAPKTPVCKKLIGGGEYCESAGSTYVPSYCYADSPISEYKATQIWNYSNNFIDRVLYSGNRLFTFSNARIDSLDIDAGLLQKGSVKIMTESGSVVPTPKPMY